MTALVTLDEVKAILRVETSSDDVLIDGIASQATSIVRDYVKENSRVSESINAAVWDQATAPAHVKAAILRICVRLYDDREGLWEGDLLDDGVKDILHRERDPALA